MLAGAMKARKGQDTTSGSVCAFEKRADGKTFHARSTSAQEHVADGDEVIGEAEEHVEEVCCAAIASPDDFEHGVCVRRLELALDGDEGEQADLDQAASCEPVAAGYAVLAMRCDKGRNGQGHHRTGSTFGRAPRQRTHLPCESARTEQGGTPSPGRDDGRSGETGLDGSVRDGPRLCRVGVFAQVEMHETGDDHHACRERCADAEDDAVADALAEGRRDAVGDQVGHGGGVGQESKRGEEGEGQEEGNGRRNRKAGRGGYLICVALAARTFFLFCPNRVPGRHSVRTGRKLNAGKETVMALLTSAAGPCPCPCPWLMEGEMVMDDVG